MKIRRMFGMMMAVAGLTASALLAPTYAQVQTNFYYDNNGLGPGVGSGGTAGVWREGVLTNWNSNDDGTGILGPWINQATTANAFFTQQGNVVVFGSDLAANTINIQSTGYTFRVADTTARSVVGTWRLGISPNQSFNLQIDGRQSNGDISTDSRELTIGSVTAAAGGVSPTPRFRLETHAAGTETFRLNIAGGTISVPLDIIGDGQANLVSTSGTSTISGSIAGNGNGLYLGATTGNTLVVNSVTNTGAVNFGVGTAGGGGGTVILGTGSKSWGDTVVDIGAAGVVRLNAGSTVDSTGSTSVVGGSLVIEGTHTGGLALSVSNGATLDVRAGGSIASTTATIDGTAIINGSFTSSSTMLINGTVSGTGTANATGGMTIAAGGTLSPGNSIGTLNITGDLSFTEGSFFNVEIDQDLLTADLLAVTGALNLGNATLNITDLGAVNNVVQDSTVLTIATFGSLSGTFAGLANNDIVVVGDNDWRISYGGAISGAITLSAVPEPSALLFVGSMVGVALVRRRR